MTYSEKEFQKKCAKNNLVSILRGWGVRNFALNWNIFIFVEAHFYDLTSSNTASLYVLVYRRCNKDNVVFVAMSPLGLSPLAGSEETTPRHSRPSRLDSYSVGNDS